MDAVARRFVLASIAWLLAGTLLGLAMAVSGPHAALFGRGARVVTAHAHLQLYGFVSMMIFGVALHALPRFEGRPLPQPRLAVAQWWAGNIGLLLFVAGLLSDSPALVAIGGVAMAAAVLAFAVQVFLLFKPARGDR